MTVRRYLPIEYDEMPGPMVLAKEYDTLAQTLKRCALDTASQIKVAHLRALQEAAQLTCRYCAGEDGHESLPVVDFDGNWMHLFTRGNGSNPCAANQIWKLIRVDMARGGEIPDILDCLDYTAKTPQSEFVDEIGPLPQCRKCGLALTVCECPKPIYEPFNASGTMCPPSPEMVEEALRNRIEDDRQGVNSVMRKNAVLLRALALATQGDFQGYIDEAERILGMV